MDHPQLVETENMNKAKRRSLPKWALIALAALVAILVLSILSSLVLPYLVV